MLLLASRGRLPLSAHKRIESGSHRKGPAENEEVDFTNWSVQSVDRITQKIGNTSDLFFFLVFFNSFIRKGREFTAILQSHGLVTLMSNQPKDY